MALAILILLIGAIPAEAQSAPDPPDAEPATIFPHAADQRWWSSAQVNFIEQMHGTSQSPYEGDNSLRAPRESAGSRLWTIYTGVALSRRLELLLDIESAGGRGLSDALELAGFTNLDTRPSPSTTPRAGPPGLERR